MILELLLAVALTSFATDAPQYSAELVFPLHPKHNHASSIVELPNGDLLVSWYRGSGERDADDVAVYGARKKKGDSKWSDAFLMADTPGFPDCNTAMFIDHKNRLWLFWPTIIANTWESCLTNFRVASRYDAPGPPLWDREAIIFLKPDDFGPEGRRLLDERLAQAGGDAARSARFDVLRQKLGDK